MRIPSPSSYTLGGETYPPPFKLVSSEPADRAILSLFVPEPLPTVRGAAGLLMDLSPRCLGDLEVRAADGRTVPVDEERLKVRALRHGGAEP